MDITSYLLGKQAGGGGTPNLQSKSVTITENGTQNITADTGYDGLSNVGITTNVSGGGIDEYLNTETNVKGIGGSANPIQLLKKSYEIVSPTTNHSLSSLFENLQNEAVLPTVVCTDSVYSFDNMFAYCYTVESVDVSKLVTSGAWRFDGMFRNCSSLKFLDLSNFITTGAENMSNMFASCSQLQHLDIRNMTFGNVSNSNYMFNYIPANCEIIVKSQTEKDWVLNVRSDLTNVKTVAEYEAS